MGRCLEPAGCFAATWHYHTQAPWQGQICRTHWTGPWQSRIQKTSASHSIASNFMVDSSYTMSKLKSHNLSWVREVCHFTNSLQVLSFMQPSSWVSAQTSSILLQWGRVSAAHDFSVQISRIALDEIPYSSASSAAVRDVFVLLWLKIKIAWSAVNLARFSIARSRASGRTGSRCGLRAIAASRSSRWDGGNTTWDRGSASMGVNMVASETLERRFAIERPFDVGCGFGRGGNGMAWKSLSSYLKGSMKGICVPISSHGSNSVSCMLMMSCRFQVQIIFFFLI